MNKFLFSFLSILLFLSANVQAGHLSGSLMVTARLNGANEVPAVVTDAQGVGIFTIGTDRKSIAIDVSVSGLSGDITGIHIHEGAPDENGGVIYNLTDFVDGNRISTTLSGIDEAALAKFLDGSYYLNVHTAANPGGEIRGQMILETDARYMASLSGDQEVPVVNTNAYGLGVFNLSKSGYKLQIKIVVQGLSGVITGAHLHNAAMGQNGGVVQNLTDDVIGNVITATVDPSAYLDELKAGNIYINVHTADNPAGEIRGQLMLNDQLYFDSFLSGSQEVPSVPTIAEGVAAISLSNDLQTLTYDVVVDGLSGSITGAHFHQGIVGENGGVVVDLTSSIDGNRISGTKDMDPNLINAFLSGGIYLNIHTANNPSGEIRGQVYKLAREPYAYQFSGGQEVPPTNSPGTGAGMVTIDRDQTNVHFMMVVSELGEMINAAHFHNAAPGENGGVIFELTSFFNDGGGAYGYWTENDMPMFENSPMFRNNEVYVNIHTSNFPSGAIRANITRTSDVFTNLPVDPGFASDLLLATRLSGDNEVPAVNTDATGVASFLIEEGRGSIEINVSVNGLSGPITGIHIHEGAIGTNGGVVINLTPFIEGNRVSTVLDDFTPAQLASMLKGEYYLNVHTEANPAGEIRGQIQLETDLTYRADLDGMQEVPSTPTDAFGLATFNLTKVLNQLEVNVLVSGLSGPITGAHLHQGATGQNGGVVVSLTEMVNGNQISGSVDATDILTALNNEEIYLNIHTEDYPSGEIRGQLILDNNLTFDTWLSGAEEVPSTTTSAMGLAAVSISPEFDQINYRVIVNDLSGSITGAHFHNAPQGENGGVVLNLTDDVMDNEIMGSATGMTVTDDLINTLLNGNIYLNVHTAGFPNGEVRGQVYRLARDGYAYDICPDQETMNVDAPVATGAGMASIDRNLSDAHVMVVVSGLTGPLQGAHIHRGAPGTDGPVVYDLTSMFDNGGLFTYWGMEDPNTPFADSLARMIQEGMAYVNIHTEMHPAGEIRGQIVKDLNCAFMTTSTQEIDEKALRVNELFPNPANHQLGLQLYAEQSAETQIQIVDLAGRTVHREWFTLLGNQTVQHQIDVSDLSPGVYYVYLKNDKYASSMKFIIAR